MLIIYETLIGHFDVSPISVSLSTPLAVFYMERSSFNISPLGGTKKIYNIYIGMYPQRFHL